MKVSASTRRCVAAMGAAMIAASMSACEGSLAGLTGGALTDAPEAARPVGEGGPVGEDGGDAAATVCPAGAFCDDFESGLLAARWAVEEDAQRSHVVADGMRAHVGSRALHVSINAAGESGGAVQHVIGPRSTGLVVVRAWYYLTAPASSVALMELRREGRSFGGVSLKLSSTKVEYDITDTKGVFRDGATGLAMTFGEWVCMRFAVELGTAGRVRILSGDATLLESVPTNTLADADAWTAVSIGLPYVADAAGAEAFVDDVVIADQMVGCQ
jgi:hypothetical protein